MPRIGGIAELGDVVARTRTITTTPPLTGGGDLSQDRVLTATTGTSTGTLATGDHTHHVATLTASGTRDATTFLRGDNTWSVPAATGGLDTEQVVDTVADALVGGQNVSIDYDDTAGTITVSAAGGSGGTTSDATTSAKGILRLAGDLAGTAASPTVPTKQSLTEKSTADTPVANGYIGADASGNTPAARLPAATTGGSGILRLAGDLGGTASAPTIVKRAPIGGHQQISYSSTITINATTGNSFYVSATGNISAINITGTAQDGQQVLLEVYASGSTRTVAHNQARLNGLDTAMTVASGQVGYVGLKYSSRAGHWVVLALGQEA